MEHWELEARESIRDLVARYNANGDSGRLDDVAALFAPDAVMVLGDGVERRGHDEIRRIFTAARENARFGDRPVYVRHMTSTLQIDVVDHHQAKSRSYFTVITDIGLDHWGRYLDEFGVIDGAWRFTSRRAITDNYSPMSLFMQRPG